jgi:endonuclease YncB( thermonuclease family)
MMHAADLDASSPVARLPSSGLSYSRLLRFVLCSAALVLGKPVAVTWRKRDRFGRLVGLVRLAVPDACGRPNCAGMGDIGLAQIESGLAWHYRRYQNEQTIEDRRRYALAERDARAKREGLWNDAHPVAPWEYRSSHSTTAMLNF